ncbi:unnamed protein product, partial [Didymodactylos carnosus]
MSASETATIKKNYTKQEIKILVDANDPLITLSKPTLFTSSHWSNFSQISVNSVLQNFILCEKNKCILKHTSSSGTNALSKHKCKIEPNSKSQQLITPHLLSDLNKSQKNKVPPAIKQRITTASLEYCVLDSRPFEQVSGVGFVSLAKTLIQTGTHHPNILRITSVEKLLPHPSTLSRNLEQMYNEQKSQLAGICTSLESYTIT